MKFNILLLIVTVLTISSVYAEGTCGDIPLIDKLKSFVQKHENHFEYNNTYNELIEQLDAFSDRTPALVDDLSKCAGFNGETSCCTDEFVSIIPDLLKGYFENKAQQKSKQFQFLLKVGREVGNCAGKDFAEEYIKSDIVQGYMEAFKQCKRSGIMAQLNIIRGTTCTVCANPDNLSDYFDFSDEEKPKLLISPEDLQAYEDAMQESFDCYQELRPQFQEFIEEYILTLPEECDDFVINVQEQFDQEAIKVEDTTCKGKLRFFEDGCLQEQEDDGAQTGIRPQPEGGYKPGQGPSKDEERRPPKDGEGNQIPEGDRKPPLDGEGPVLDGERIKPPPKDGEQQPPQKDGEQQPPPQDGQQQPPPQDDQQQPPPEGNRRVLEDDEESDYLESENSIIVAYMEDADEEALLEYDEVIEDFEDLENLDFGSEEPADPYEESQDEEDNNSQIMNAGFAFVLILGAFII